MSTSESQHPGDGEVRISSAYQSFPLSPDNTFLRSPHQPSPQPQRSHYETGATDNRETLLSTSEDIFVIPPALNIDEKLFLDEVILWSHYVRASTALKQPQSIFSFFFFFFFLIATVILALFASIHFSGERAAVVTVWLMSPVVLFSGFTLYKQLMEHTCYFVTNYRIIECKLLAVRLTTKSMSYTSILDIKTTPNTLSFYARHRHPFIKFIGVEGVNSVLKIIQQRRENPSFIGPIDSPKSLEMKDIPQKFCSLIQVNDLPFLEVNQLTKSRYLMYSVKFISVYLWVAVLLFLAKADTFWIVCYFSSILILPVILILSNTVQKVDVVGSRAIVFLRVGLTWGTARKCKFGRNIQRLGYEHAYPLVCQYNIRDNKGVITFTTFKYANFSTSDVIVSEELIFHKHQDALASTTSM